jgi:uridine kinase
MCARWRGATIERPVYDFKTHSRVAGSSKWLRRTAVVIVEGILALHYDDLLSLL